MMMKMKLEKRMKLKMKEVGRVILTALYNSCSRKRVLAIVKTTMEKTVIMMLKKLMVINGYEQDWDFRF
ncbi:hypothetical protein SLA2020_302820 [Shorea laevis]